MGTTDESTIEEYGSVEIDDRGQITIPKELREALQIEGGTEFTVVRDGGEIRLVRDLPELQTLTAEKSDEEWEGKAFRDAGEDTFGER